ncbi:hypothetical protein EDD30_2587 [Couchioplanes caeruleus]|uniref:DUF732 domain-containing protein n=3 Tax=Couchioplanes caeruleus TaxID=56438 RepID=A0A1K0GHJ2_9ACTN|nr:hypothetical protein BG844_32135 [Couchioplanes caeruleus subsp. caeruleus]ROP29775.1 hypothetical protein EDD30_2587 [Couchioplanes caeruleus]
MCALLLLAVIAGCTEPAGAPAPAPATAAPPSTPAVADEPPGALACGKIGEAVREGSLMQPGVITGVSASTATADAPVADAAARLQQAYEQAVKAQGAEEEPDLVAAVSGAAAEMVAVCSDSGLSSGG